MGTSVILFRHHLGAHLGAHLGPLFYNLMQQKLESGPDASGCVRRTCVDAKLDFNFLIT